jgi:hypothetical protein
MCIFDVVAPDGVWTRRKEGVEFHASPPPTRVELQAMVERVQRRALDWLRRHGHLDRGPDASSQEPPVQTAIDACAAIAMARGQTATLANERELAVDGQSQRTSFVGAVELDGFNLHADVSIQAGDDAGREKLWRYAARPALSLARLRRVRGGRVAYHLTYVRGSQGKYRIMEPMEFLARLAALIAPPRYPLVRYAGVLGPRSAWRKDIVPRPREPARAHLEHGAKSSAPPPSPRTQAPPSAGAPGRGQGAAPQLPSAAPTTASSGTGVRAIVAPLVIALAPNMLSVKHWDRLLGGILYAATPRIDWARLLRRSMDVDVLTCPKCDGRLRVLAVITERASVQRVLSHLGVPLEPPVLARARDPTDALEDAEPRGQLELLLG